ncbi:unnamed protein product, partial [Ectocarpus fasciculatus]
GRRRANSPARGLLQHTDRGEHAHHGFQHPDHRAGSARRHEDDHDPGLRSRDVRHDLLLHHQFLREAGLQLWVDQQPSHRKVHVPRSMDHLQLAGVLHDRNTPVCGRHPAGGHHRLRHVLGARRGGARRYPE